MTTPDDHRRAWLDFMGHDLPPVIRYRVTCPGPDCLLSHSPQTYPAAAEALALQKAHRSLFPRHLVAVASVAE